FKGDMEDEIFALITPYIMFVIPIFSYIAIVVIFPRIYTTIIKYLYAETFRDLLGQTPEEYYGKKYRKNKKVLKSIEEYKNEVN
ncbi:MAG: hypothetical protein ACRCTA_03160, partial [Bacilli bacterium]